MLQYTTMDRVFAKVKRDITSDFDELEVVEWTGEALEAMLTRRSFEEAVAFIEVKNHQCELPPRLHGIIQIAKNNLWTPQNKNCVTPSAIITETPNVTYKCDGQDMGYVVLDACGTPVLEYDIAYYRPYFDLLTEYYGWVNCNTYKRAYTPVRLATNSFFNSIVCKELNQSPYTNCKDEYTVIPKVKILRFSFDCGSVAVAYLRQLTDNKTGWPLIPDEYSNLSAIVAYISYRMANREFQNNREGSITKKRENQQDWDWYCGQAVCNDMMPQGEDEHQNLLSQRQYLIPQQNSYFSYFGGLNENEIRKFNDPDMRNNRLHYIS